MKKLLSNYWHRSILAGIVFLGILFTQPSKAEDWNGVSFQVFYDELQPYGDWIKDARHGYIWLPAVQGDFHPYRTNGHWVMTEYGNTWVSYYDWGWAPFHYGRWYFDDYFQSWAWIPGYDWGPAWVSWRSGGGYYGWAPLGPAFSVNVRINIPTYHWVFLPCNRIYDRYSYRYYAPYNHRVKIINRTKIINNTVIYNNNTYITGPSRREVERTIRRTVPVYQVRQSSNPGRASVSRNSVDIYRPDLQASSRGRTVDARPSRVSSPDQVRSTRSAGTANAGGRNSEIRSDERSAYPSRGGQNSRYESSPSRSSNDSRVRTAEPSRGRDANFEMRPYQENRRGSSPAPSRQGEVRNSPNTSREADVRRPSAPSRQSDVRTQPSRQSNVRTQPAPSRQESVRPDASRRSTPQVNTRSSAPSRSNSSPAGSRVQRPSSNTKSTGAKVESRSSSNRSSSGSTRGSSSRGNSRNN